MYHPITVICIPPVTRLGRGAHNGSATRTPPLPCTQSLAHRFNIQLTCPNLAVFIWLATYLTHAWLVNNSHRFCLPFASLRVAMLLWEADTARFGQVSCMLNLCASDCVHESGGMHVADQLCAPQPGDRWDANDCWYLSV